MQVCVGVGLEVYKSIRVHMCVCTWLSKIVQEEEDACTLRYASASGMYTSMCGSHLWGYPCLYTSCWGEV